MESTPEEIKKHVKMYALIGYILIGCTFLTVAVATFSWLDVPPHGLSTGDILVGLMIATLKASLVALIFMHLNSEKHIIYKFLLFTVFFFFGLMFLTLYALWDPIKQIFLVP